MRRAWLLTEFAQYYRYRAPQKMKQSADAAVELLRQHPSDDWSYVLAAQLAGRSRLVLGEYEAAEGLFPARPGRHSCARTEAFSLADILAGAARGRAGRASED